mmetsp:Transcript_13415/g.43721  ORF Transcript_13415/g.43721 Transcript_13415/m.43721 type:complete len:253 (-) Transcript_13415:124-882(-)
MRAWSSSSKTSSMRPWQMASARVTRSFFVTSASLVVVVSWSGVNFFCSSSSRRRTVLAAVAQSSACVRTTPRKSRARAVWLAASSALSAASRRANRTASLVARGSWRRQTGPRPPRATSRRGPGSWRSWLQTAQRKSPSGTDARQAHVGWYHVSQRTHRTRADARSFDALDSGIDENSGSRQKQWSFFFRPGLSSERAWCRDAAAWNLAASSRAASSSSSVGNAASSADASKRHVRHAHATLDGPSFAGAAA